MEVWLDLKTLAGYFNGKWRELYFRGQSRAFCPGIAIRIIQIGLDDEKSLLDFLRSHDELAASSDGDSEVVCCSSPPVDAAS